MKQEVKIILREASCICTYHTESHIEVLKIKLAFFLFDKLQEDIFATLLLFIDLFTIKS